MTCVISAEKSVLLQEIIFITIITNENNEKSTSTDAASGGVLYAACIRVSPEER
jgi:hypothetical protein